LHSYDVCKINTVQSLEQAQPGVLGRVAVVLDGDNIGSRLRAGAQKYAIEPLN